MKLIAIRNELKQTIAASGGLGLLQMVSEPDTGWCSSKDARSLKGWIVRSHVPYKGVETFSLAYVFYNYEVNSDT